VVICGGLLVGTTYEGHHGTGARTASPSVIQPESFTGPRKAARLSPSVRGVSALCFRGPPCFPE